MDFFLGVQLHFTIDQENEISTIREIEALWKDTSPSKQELAFAMIKAVLEYKE